METGASSFHSGFIPICFSGAAGDVLQHISDSLQFIKILSHQKVLRIWQHIITAEEQK